MEENIENKIKAAVESVKLSSSEKESLKSRILEVVSGTDVISETHIRHNGYQAGNKSIPVQNITGVLTFKKIMGAFIAVVLIAAGGVGVAAEGAVPGSALYPVKVNINEEVKSAIAVTAESQAKLDAALAAERLEEAEILVARGELDADTGVKLSERFEIFANRSMENIAKLESKGDFEEAIEVAGGLESAIEAHESVLARLSAKGEDEPEAEETEESSDSDSGENAQTVAESTAKVKNGVSKARADLEAEFVSKDLPSEAASGKIEAAGNVIASVEEFVSRKESEAVEESRTEAKEALEDAKSVRAEAKAYLEDGDTTEAFLQAGSAIRLAQKARTIISADIKASEEEKDKDEQDEVNEDADESDKQEEEGEEGDNDEEKDEDKDGAASAETGDKALINSEANAKAQTEVYGSENKAESRGRGEGRIEVNLGL